jgi:hypothetical protein
MTQPVAEPIMVLLIEDDPGDVVLIQLPGHGAGS